MKIRIFALASSAVLSASSFALTLGSYTFNDNQFGNTLIESDGGAFSAGNWLNTTNADPGNPAYLTGADVETGIANIGFSGSAITYTIGYSTPIVNNAGDDFGVIVARFSSDDFDVAVSEDGVNFSADMTISSATAGGTGVFKSYYYGGGGPYGAFLYVHSLDLSAFGMAGGSSAMAIRVTGYTQLDLIRVAGLEVVPEPGSMLALGGGLAFLVARKRRAK